MSKSKTLPISKTLSSFFLEAIEDSTTTTTKSTPSTTSKPKTLPISRTLSAVFSEAIEDSSSSSTTTKSTPSTISEPKTLPISRTLSAVFLEAIKDSSSSSTTKSKPISVADSLRRASDNLRPPPTGDRVSDSTKSWNLEPENVEICKSVEDVCNSPIFNAGPDANSSWRKDKSRIRKGRWIFNRTSKYHFEELIRLCANKLGTENVIPVFGNLRRETGLKEYNALIGICVEKAANSFCSNVEISTREIDSAFKLLDSMVEEGFQLKEETYGILLRFFIDKHMVEEFQRLSVIVKSENPASLSKLAYYEMLLWNKVGNKEKIKELLAQIPLEKNIRKFTILENYLLAACESDMKKEILQLLDILDIATVTSKHYLAKVFRALGRFSFQPTAEKLISTLKTSGRGENYISNLISDFVINIPNLSVEEMMLNFNNMHERVEISPHYLSNEKLIKNFCDLRKVHSAISLINLMSYSAASKLSTGTLNAILDACSEACEFQLAHELHKMILHFQMKANSETYSTLIDMNVRAKNFDAAYSIIHELKSMNMVPIPCMYNSILAGYFRENRAQDALNVVKEMGNENLKLNSQTYCYLIANCTCINDITKYYDEMVNLGVHFTKHVYMALINAYTTCRHFDEAKQVVEKAPGKILSELRNVLLSALACNGRTLEALSLYKDIKLSGCYMDLKSILTLIESSINSGEDMGVLLELLDELEGGSYWVDGCCNVVMCCVRRGHLSHAVNLLKRLKDATPDEVARETMLDEAFSQLVEAEEVDVGFGKDLLRAVKEDLELTPSRKCLDFLLAACVRAKDRRNSALVWKEYQKAGLPYNTISYLRMYQALLCAGDRKAAANLLSKMPTDDDHHVLLLLNSFREAYHVSRKIRKKAARRL